ncbi:MAG: VPLPA-CTERM-specific exosortase XrtD [Pseudomonadota bacterium]
MAWIEGQRGSSVHRGAVPWGLVWLVIATLGAAAFFADGTRALMVAWQSPEYSHGPLIPILSALLFLRQLRDTPARAGPDARWVGVTVIAAALALGTLGHLAQISDLVAYAIIVWTGGVVLVTFGWRTGRQFWPPVLHLVYMLPLPGVVYFKLTTGLQLVSSEIGVSVLRLLSVPVFLQGNIIDLGVMKLHVAEACSGLRYLFPILSFSYIFAVLYRGPMWHKAVLLLAAAPISVLMNSLRIALAGVIVNAYGPDWVEGFTHFFEGWVVFLACIALLFALAWGLLLLHPARPCLADALDLNVEGLGAQLRRLGYVVPSRALGGAALATAIAAALWMAVPDRVPAPVERDPFALFPRQLGDWAQTEPARTLSPAIARALGADDYRSATFQRPGEGATVDLFLAWYADQSHGGVHSPEICLPGAGWEIAWLERTDMAPHLNSAEPFHINRAIIQRGEARMMVFYWFEQKGRRIAWDFAAKYWLMVDGIATGRTDGGLVRLTTPMGTGEGEAAAEARLQEMLRALIAPLPRFVPGG